MVLAFLCLLAQGGRATQMEDDNSQTSFYHATLIGINRYQYHKSLKTPVNDVRELSGILKSRYGFQTKLLLDEEATEQGIRDELARLVYESAPTDSVLLYFAGHGTAGTDQSGFWVPSGASLNITADYISNSDIIKFAENCPAKHVLIVSDACFSGSIFKGSGTSDEKLEISEAYGRASRWVISSGNLTTVDDVGPAEKHSPFAHYLIDNLDRNDQPYLTPSDLVLNLVRDVARVSQRHQLPKVGPLLEAGHEGGSFVFWNKGLSDRDGNPFPPPWEASARDFLPAHLRNLHQKQIYVANPTDPSICDILREALGMVVDCDLNYETRIRRTIITRCSDIKHKWVEALRAYLKLDRYELRTHEDQPEDFDDDDCGTPFEITIYN